MRVIHSLSEVIGPYSAVLCDVWGVLHAGGPVFPSAHSAIDKLNQRGCTIILVSNAPHSGRLVQERLERRGLPRSSYKAVITAGDITLQALLRGNFGRRCYFIGTPHDRELLNEANLEEVGEERAEFALVSGLEADAATYQPTLTRLVSAGLELVCANPDRVVRVGSSLIPCAGSLAQLYEQLGGKVSYFGKPHHAIYAHALAHHLPDVDRRQCLAIGDGLLTDIRGAQNEGMDSLFIAGGIHASEGLLQQWKEGKKEASIDKRKLANLLSEKGCTPTYALARLQWSAHTQPEGVSR